MTGLVSSDPAGTDITFSWDDYVDTNANAANYGQNGQQAARAMLPCCSTASNRSSKLPRTCGRIASAMRSTR